MGRLTTQIIDRMVDDGEYHCQLVVSIPSLQFLVTNGIKAVTNSAWNGTAQATGDLLQVSSMEESADLGVSTITVSLSGLNSDTVEDARDLNVQGNEILVFLSFEHNGNYGYKAVEWFRGNIDDMIYVQNGQDIAIQVKATSFLDRFNDVNVRRFTKEDHRIYYSYSSDRGLRFVESIADQNLVWGE